MRYSLCRMGKVLPLKIPLLVFLVTIFLHCGGGKGYKKPLWLDRGVSPPYYVAQSTLQPDRKEALNEAFYGALREFYIRELGIILDSDTRLRKQEVGDEVIVEYESSIQARTFIGDVKVRSKKEYLEQEKGRYRGYVCILIPQEEMIRARQSVKKYLDEALESAEKEIQKAELLEENSYTEALLGYKTAAIILEDLIDPIARALKKKVDARIQALKRFEDPGIQLMELQSTASYFEQAELIRLNREESSNFVDIGDTLQLHFSVKKPVYLYILSYWREQKEIRLLYPNWLEEEENLISGKSVFPKRSGFVAAPPGGLNLLFVIATKMRIDLDEKSMVLSRENLEDFLKSLRDIEKYEIRRLEVFIRE